MSRIFFRGRDGYEIRPVPKWGDSSSVVNLIYDSDYGTDPGDPGALALLHYYADLGKCNILALGNCNTNQYGATCLAAINQFYGRGSLPVGQNKGSTLNPGPDPDVFNKFISQNYPHPYITTSDNAENVVTLYRRILANMPDQSVTFGLGGFLTNLAALLASAGDSYSSLSGLNLVARKVRKIVCSAAQFPNSDVPEYNILIDVPSAIEVVNDVDLPIRFNGFEIGNLVDTGSTIIANTGVTNPVRHAFDIWFTKHNVTTRQSWDQIGVILAIFGLTKEGATWFSETTGGSVQIAGDGNNTWETVPPKQHSYVTEVVEAATLIEEIDVGMTTTPKYGTATTPTIDALVRSDMVAYWTMGEVSGDRMDSVGTHHLTPAFVSQTTGKVGQAASFVGNSYLTCANSAELTMGDFDFSGACWVLLSSKSIQSYIMAKAQESVGAAEYTVFWEHGSDQFGFFIWNGVTPVGQVYATNFGSPALDTWYFLQFWNNAGDANGKSIGIRVNDGVPNYQSYTGALAPTVARFGLGANPWNLGQEFLTGSIDGAFMAKRMLTLRHFDHIYNGGDGREHPFS